MSEVLIPANGPWCFQATLGLLDGDAIDGLEQVDTESATINRVISQDNFHRICKFRLTPEGVWMNTDCGDLEPLVRWWFDLDTDIQKVDEHLRNDSLLAPQIEQVPGIRIARYPDTFEAAILTVLGQQVSLRAARTFAGRLVRAYGEHVEGGMQAFPTPRALINASAMEMQRIVGVTNSRIATVKAVAKLFLQTDIQLGPLSENTLQALLNLHGIGAWTISYLQLRATTRIDALLVGDVVLNRATGKATPEDLTKRWSPYCAHGVFRAWNLDVKMY